MKIFLLVVAILLIFPGKIEAQNYSDQYISVVNPVRVSQYNLASGESLKSQYEQIKSREFPATWLFTFDALNNQEIKDVAGQMDKNQEFGIFLEVSEGFASESGVLYNKSDSWHRAKSVFLSGYTQEDRVRLIDRVFSKFKDSFGSYPASVGGWWVDSYSLSYMREKYGVVAVLGCADQFSTDGYQLWGQPWSIPYYPSKIHTGMPANTALNKLDVVVTQWAPRDPLNGYINPYGKNASLYSTQDYHTVSLNEEYFRKLLILYTQKNGNDFGFITLGLESDFSPDTYNGVFARQMDLVKTLENEGRAKVLTMKSFSTIYRNKYPDLSPGYFVFAEDLLGSGFRSFWYQSPNYRIGGVLDDKNDKLSVVDFRVYPDNFEEPYFTSPNQQLDLFINNPSVIDKVSNFDEDWEIKDRDFLVMIPKSGVLKLDSTNGSIEFDPNKISLRNINQIPEDFKNSNQLEFQSEGDLITLTPKKSWIVNPPGYIFRDITPQGLAFLNQKKILIAGSLGILLFIGFVVWVIRKRRLRERFIFVGIPLVLILSLGAFWVFRNSQNYFVSQSEIDALEKLRISPKGNVLIFDQVCLQCSWETEFTPAVFANKRNYVRDFSEKLTVSNNAIFTTNNRESAKEMMKALNVQYIYLVRIEDYQEKINFSPGDLNIEKIHANANAEVWRIKD